MRRRDGVHEGTQKNGDMLLVDEDCSSVAGVAWRELSFDRHDLETDAFPRVVKELY
jgi:hypothetical protein